MSDRLTHLNERGEARMVNVGDKAETLRRARASGRIMMQRATLELIQAGGIAKGDVLAVARVAGIMGAKRTSELIPLCHPLALSSVDVDLYPLADPPAIEVVVTVTTTGRTGVEMEALTAVQTALATVYDMCKAVDRGMVLTDIGLLEKSGGRSGTWVRDAGVPRP